MRESGTTSKSPKPHRPGEPGALVSAGLPSSSSLPISAMKDRVFEEHIREARLKYQALESQYESEVDHLKQANDKATAENESLKAEIERYHDRIKALESDISQHENHAEEHRVLNMSASIDLEKRLDRLEAVLASRQLELEQVKQRARADRVDAAATLKAAQDDIETTQTQLKASTEREKEMAQKLMRIEKEHLEIQEIKHNHHDDDASTRALIQECEEYKAIIKRMELERSTVEATSERRQTHCEEYLKEIQELKSALTKHETRRHANEQARERAAQVELKWSDELVLLRRKVDEMRSEVEQDREIIARLQTEVSSARRDLIEVSEERTDLVNEVEIQKDELAKTQTEIENSLSKEAGVEALNNVLQKSVDDAHLQIADLQHQVDVLTKERDQIRAQTDLLQKRYSLCKSMETLKQTDLTGLLQSHLQMVKSLESITSQIKLAEST